MTAEAARAPTAVPLLARALLSWAAAAVLAAGCLAGVLVDRAAEFHARTAETAQAEMIAAEAAAQIASYIDAGLLRADALHELAGRIVLADFFGAPEEVADAARRNLLVELARDGADIEQVTCVDGRGMAVWSTLGGAPVNPVDLSDRAHIRAIFYDGKAEHVGDIVRGRISGSMTLQFTRRIAAPEGRTLGVSVVSLRPAVLAGAAERLGGGMPWTLVRAATGAPIMSSETFVADRPPAGPSAGREAVTMQRPTARLGLAVETRFPQERLDGAILKRRLRGNLTGQPAVAIGTMLGLCLVVMMRYRSHSEAIAAARRRDAAALARLTMIADSVSTMVALWRIPRAGAPVLEFVSGASRALLGLSPERLMAGDAWPCDADGEPVFARHLQRCLAGSGPAAEEVLFRSAEGEEKWLECHGFHPAAGGDGERRLITTYHDITAEKRLAREAAKTRQRIELVMETAPCLFYEVHIQRQPDGALERTLLYISPQIEQYTGIPAERYLGTNTPLWSMQSKEANAARFAYLQRLAEVGRGSDECDVMLPNGNATRVRTSDIYTRIDACSGVVTGFSWDITRESALESEVERNAKLAFLGEMAAGMGHEMAQPLAAISLQAAMLEAAMPDGLLRDPAAAPKVLSRIRGIGEMVGRTADVIDRVRRFSRNETLSVAPFGLGAAIGEAVQLLAPKLRKAGVEVRQTPSAEAALGDAGAFGQVMVNLIGNAADAYMSRKDAVGRVIAVEVDRIEGMVRVTVTDEAGGIDPEVMKRMFAPFVTTKTSTNGTGIGLSICLRLMRWMGGDIRAENIPGGARFTVLVPAHAAARADEA